MMHLIHRIVLKRSGRKNVPAMVVPRCWETWCGKKRNENAKDIRSRVAEVTCVACKEAMVQDALAGTLNVSW